MNRTFLRLHPFLTGTLLMLAFACCEARAGETNLFAAHMQTPSIVLSPASNGVMDLTCKVGFIGGCCFPLTSHDVTAALDVPAGVTVLSGPEPATYAAIEAPPSGTPQVWATFRWRLQQTHPENGGELTLTVSSRGADAVRSIYALSPQSRIRINGPTLPDTYPAGKELPIAVDATCLDQDRFVKTVRFCYSTDIPANAQNVELPADLAGRGILRFSSDGRQLMVQGRFIDLARKYEPTVWHGALSVQTHDALSGIAIATDDQGHTAQGQVVRIAAPAGAGGGGAQPNGSSPSGHMPNPPSKALRKQPDTPPTVHPWSTSFSIRAAPRANWRRGWKPTSAPHHTAFTCCALWKG